MLQVANTDLQIKAANYKTQWRVVFYIWEGIPQCQLNSKYAQFNTNNLICCRVYVLQHQFGCYIDIYINLAWLFLQRLNYLIVSVNLGWNTTSKQTWSRTLSFSRLKNIILSRQYAIMMINMRHRRKELLQGPPPRRTHRISYLLESNFRPHMTWIVNDGKTLRQL